MRGARRFVAASASLVVFELLGSFVGATGTPGTSESDFRIDSEHVDAGPISIGTITGLAQAKLVVEERPDGGYRASGTMRGTYFAYKSRLSFRVDGHVVAGRHQPRHYEARVVHDSVFADDETLVTTFDFDRGRADTRSVLTDDDGPRVLYDRAATIEPDVRDLVSGILDILATPEARDVDLRTLVEGRVTTYRVRHLGSGNVTVAGAPVSCRMYSLSIPGAVIDENPYRFTFWSRPGYGSVVQARIAPGPSSLIARLLRTRWR